MEKSDDKSQNPTKYIQFGYEHAAGFAVAT